MDLIIIKMAYKKNYSSKRKAKGRKGRRGFKRSSTAMAGYGRMPGLNGYDVGYSAKCTLAGIINNISANNSGTLYAGWGMNPVNGAVSVHTASPEFVALAAVF